MNTTVKIEYVVTCDDGTYDSVSVPYYQKENIDNIVKSLDKFKNKKILDIRPLSIVDPVLGVNRFIADVMV